MLNLLPFGVWYSCLRDGHTLRFSVTAMHHLVTNWQIEWSHFLVAIWPVSASRYAPRESESPTVCTVSYLVAVLFDRCVRVQHFLRQIAQDSQRRCYEQSNVQKREGSIVSRIIKCQTDHHPSMSSSLSVHESAWSWDQRNKHKVTVTVGFSNENHLALVMSRWVGLQQMMMMWDYGSTHCCPNLSSFWWSERNLVNVLWYGKKFMLNVTWWHYLRFSKGLGLFLNSNDSLYI
jgi:hypothetical protein